MPQENIQWLHIGVGWTEVESWLSCGPWMFSPRDGGAHRVEYSWIIELRCCCKDYSEKPPTPAKD